MIRNWREVVLGLLLWLGLLIPARAAAPEAVFFLTNLAQRFFLLQSNEFNPLTNSLPLRSILEVPVAPTNLYSGAIHRLFQVAANLYDATTTNEHPLVFRPLLETRSNGVFLTGFTCDDRVSTLGDWLETKPHALPLIIPARSGRPAFNEFVLQGDFTVQRRLELIRPTGFARPNGTNQMYLLGMNQFVGVELWHASDAVRVGPYPRALTITISNLATLTFSNAQGALTNREFACVQTTNLPAGSWQGGFEEASFRLPLLTNLTFLTNAIYRFGANRFEHGDSWAFEVLPGYPFPNWGFGWSNHLTVLLEEEGRIVDFVILQAAGTVDLQTAFFGTMAPYGSFPLSSSLLGLWSTNRQFGPLGPPDGVIRQLEVSLGFIPTSLVDWIGLDPTAGLREQSIDAFRHFVGLSPIYGTPFPTNRSLSMTAPFNPAAKLIVARSWQVNDPLVAYPWVDLELSSPSNWAFLKPAQRVSNFPPASLGRLNPAFMPWGGNPLTSISQPLAYSAAVRDPGVYSPMDWHFPSGEDPDLRWLGRVHRGTPWQTFYLKSAAASLADWARSSSDQVVMADGSRLSRTHPTNDWRQAALLASLWHPNDPRALTSINQPNPAMWGQTFSGLTVLSNISPSALLGMQPLFETNLIAAEAPPIAVVLAGLERTRSARPGQYFAEVAEFLTCPELSLASPWLNRTGDQLRWGLTDEAYESLPAQLLPRVRADPVGRIRVRPDGLGLSFRVFSGASYLLESSDDLRQWSPVGEPQTAAGDSLELSEPESGGRKFYRLRWWP